MIPSAFAHVMTKSKPTPAAVAGPSSSPPPFVPVAASAVAIVELEPRLARVALLIASGHSNREIAVDLGCAFDTAKLYVSELLKKTKISSRVRLAVWAYVFRVKLKGRAGL